MANIHVKSHLESAIKSNVHFPQAHYELAKILLEENNIIAAITSLKNAINTGMEKTSIFKKKGNSLIKRSQFSHAKHNLHKMELSKYNTSIYLAELSQIYMASNDVRNAKKYALKSLKEYPEQPQAMNMLANIYFSNNKWKSAGDWLTKSLELDFKNEITHLLLAQVKQKQKKSKSAVHHYLIAKDLNPNILSQSLDKLSEKYPNL